MDIIETFNEQEFEQKLFNLKDTHDCISHLSAWCLMNDDHHEKVVATWLSVLKKVSTEHKLLMFYLANDIIQYSKRKSLPYVDSFAPALQKATTMVRDETIRNKILRLFKIWDERNIYEESFLVDLSGLLTRGHKNVSKADIDEFQPSVLFTRLQSCKALEDDTDIKMKVLVESELPLTDVEKMKESLRDRKASEEVYNDVNDGVNKIKQFIAALEAEIKERTGLIDLLDVGEQYYDKEMGEAKVVVNAYNCFTTRVKLVKRKLDERIEGLSSPNLSTGVIAPSLPPDDPSARTSGALKPANFPTGGSFIGNQQYVKEFQEFTKGKANEADDSFPPKSYTSPLYFTSNMRTGGDLPPRPPGLSLNSASLLLPPPPPPPPPPLPSDKYPPPYNPLHTLYPSLAYSAIQGSKIDILNTAPPPPPPPIEEMSKSQSSVADVSLPPPPTPPKQIQYSSQTGPAAADKFAWSETTGDWESPESPPNFEKEGYPASFDVPLVSGDVDMRCKDVDHRNLISLTGNSDTDIRVPPWSSDNLTDAQFPTDNVENVDMEMSDDEDRKNEAELDRSKYPKNSKSLNGNFMPNKHKDTDSRVLPSLGEEGSESVLEGSSNSFYPFAPPPPPPFPPPSDEAESSKNNNGYWPPPGHYTPEPSQSKVSLFDVPPPTFDKPPPRMFTPISNEPLPMQFDVTPPPPPPPPFAPHHLFYNMMSQGSPQKFRPQFVQRPQGSQNRFSHPRF